MLSQVALPLGRSLASPRGGVGALLALLSVTLPLSAHADELPSELRELRPFLTEYCYDCHDSETKKGGLDLEKLEASFGHPAQFESWVKVHDRMRAGEMPPKKKVHPPQGEGDLIAGWLGTALSTADTARQKADVRSGIRRLSRVEFENTLRDLLHVPGLRVLGALPADGKAHGFERAAEALDFSFVHLETYLGAVDVALNAATPAFVEQPPVFTYRWHPQEEPGMAILAKNTEAIGLIGLTRDETFEAQYPKIIDEEPKSTAVGVFRHGDADFRYTVRPFIPVLDGWYRIRVRGYSFAWDGQEVVPTDKHGAVAFGVFSKGLNYGMVDLPPNFAGESELTAWLERGGGMTHGVSDTIMFTPETCERLRDYAHGKFKGVLGPIRAAPGVALEWIDFEGPIQETWPPASQRALFGDLPVALWSKESGEPQPLQQKWGSGKHPSTKPEDIYGVRNEKRPLVQVVSAAPEKDARRLLAAFLRRAFRRSVEVADIEPYAALFAKRIEAGDHFQDALKAAYRSALTSPDFLLLRGSGPGAVASRLSYFLWAGPPDEELLDLAERGKLAKPEVLRAQVGRLLADPRAGRFVEDFTGQWLRLREIDATQPDKQLYPEFTPLLQEAMLGETRAYFAELLRGDLGISHLVKSDFAMLNEPLAELYGIPGVRGHAMRRVALPPGSLRGAFLTQASVLKITANGTTTSPVTRGAFVMEKLLGIVPTPPPPGTGSLEPDTRGTTTVREQLEKHKTDATCAGCHVKMDPYGFALESFDVMGEAREQYRALGGEGPDALRKVSHGQPVGYHFSKEVDSSGQLPDGRPFHDLHELRDLMAADEESLARAFVGHLISYATGAPVSFADRAEVEAILARAKGGHYGVRTLLTETVLSPLFSRQ